MFKNLRFLVVSLCALSATYANANIGVTLGQPAYGGNGCPSGSATATLSPDQTELSILFDQYMVETGNGSGFARKTCNIAIPVQVPQGYSVSVFAIDYRGYTHLPAGGRARLNVDYFIPGGSGQVRTVKNFTGPLSADYVKSDSLGLQAVVWSACGASTILRANTAIQVQTNSPWSYSMATVDSADVSAGLIYHLQWRRCN